MVSTSKTVEYHDHWPPWRLWLTVVFMVFCNTSFCQIIAQQGNWSDLPRAWHNTNLTLVEKLKLILENQGTTTSSDLLPTAVRVKHAAVIASHLIIKLDFAHADEEWTLSEPQLEQLSRLIDLNSEWLAPDIKHIHFSTDVAGKSVSLSSLLNIPPVPDKADDMRSMAYSHAPISSNGSVTDLSEKTLFISQAHGWIDYDDFREWSTQRGITHDIVEDFVNAEGINQYLLQYLHHAGAEVFTLRERDLNTNMVIVDDADGLNHPNNGTYQEIGDSKWFANSGANGFANFQAPYSPTDDPFRDNGGSDRVITTSPTETARAVWTPVIQQSGLYDVFVSYSGIGNRASDAKYTVRHGGIDTQFVVDQTKHRYVWNYLGNFYFVAGGDHAIILSNQSAQSGTTVSADAVRLGGGMGDVMGEYHNVLSGHPRWEEGARTWTQYQGANSSVYQSGDVTARSRFADWEHYSSEDSVYVSWHSNAATGNARGTSSYIYSSNPPDGTYDPNQSHPGSADLQTAIHDELINDIRSGWDINWVDRGKRSAYFGEVNPNHNDEMPAVLLELAFHDNASDADALRHPQFRKLAARAIYQGIVKYFAARDGLTYTLLPEPPTHLQITSPATGELHVQWQAPLVDGLNLAGDAAVDYLVYFSADGKNFDNGTVVNGLSLHLTGLTPGEIHYVKVKARNPGGLSLATETLASRVAYENETRVLVVNGFDRLNSGQLIYQDMPDIGGFVDRMYLSQMNTFDYIIQHGQAIHEAGVGFDSISNELIEDELLDIDATTYPVTLWILGEESSLGETLSVSEQAQIVQYLIGGGQLFISGAEIAWDLDFLGSQVDQDFYQNTLLTAYVADAANSHQASGVAGSPFSQLSQLEFDDGTGDSYAVEFADVLSPMPGANSCLVYVSSGSACTYADTGVYRFIHLGFPFETITHAGLRNDMMSEAMNFFLVPYFSDVIFADGFN